MIDLSEATDREILAAVEEWALARGWLGPRGNRRPPDSQPWEVLLCDGAVFIARLDKALQVKTWNVTPLVALAWALMVESGDVVDVGRCPATRPNPNGKGEPDRCQGGKTQRWIGKARRSPTEWLRDGLTDCPDCGGTGIDRREAARLVLDAAPVKCDDCEGHGWISDSPWAADEVEEDEQEDCPACNGLGKVGDPTSIEALTVHAERLMTSRPEDAQRPERPLTSLPLGSRKAAREWAAANAVTGDTFTVHPIRDIDNVRKPQYVAELHPDPEAAHLWANERIVRGELLALYLHRWAPGDGREGSAAGHLRPVKRQGSSRSTRARE